MEYGLVLSGGGTKGSFEIGVCKALNELNIPISAVSGTSVGAINGAIIASNNLDWAIDFWTNLCISHVFDISKIMTEKYISDWSQLDLRSYIVALKNAIFDGGMDITPLKSNLEKYIDEEIIRQSPIRLGLVTVSAKDFKPLELMAEEIPKGKLIDYILASAAFPSFKPMEIDGVTFIDGGFYDKLPINLLAREGYKNLITVDLPAPGIKARRKYKDLNIIQVNNSDDLGSFFDFTPGLMKRNIQMGYLDTLKKFNKISGSRYYINMYNSETPYQGFKDRLGENITGEDGQKLSILLCIDYPADKQVILEVLNKILRKTKYKNITLPLSLLEITADTLGIERLKIYTPAQLMREILVSFNDLLQNNINLINSTESITELFKGSKDVLGTPISNIQFVSYYMYYSSLNADSESFLSKLISRFSPEIVLSIVTLRYLIERREN